MTFTSLPLRLDRPTPLFPFPDVHAPNISANQQTILLRHLSASASFICRGPARVRFSTRSNRLRAYPERCHRDVGWPRDGLSFRRCEDPSAPSPPTSVHLAPLGASPEGESPFRPASSGPRARMNASQAGLSRGHSAAASTPDPRDRPRTISHPSRLRGPARRQLHARPLSHCLHDN
jgi:hypothetical protein